MADRAQLEQTLNERGVSFDYYATDEALQALVAQSEVTQYDPAQQLADRGQLEVYLQGRHIAYDESASDDELRTLVLTQQDAEHARFLETYTPVITRLPGAVNTSPELPEQAPDESEAEPQAAATGTEAEPAGAAAGGAPAAAVEQPGGQGLPGQAPAVDPGADPAA